MPSSQTQRALQRIVVGVANAVELVHAAVVRKLRHKLAVSSRLASNGANHCRSAWKLINIQHDRELATLTADVAHLPHCRTVAETLLHVEVVVEEIGCSEVLADPKHVENGRSTFRGLSGDAGCNRIEYVGIRLPRVGRLIRSIGGVGGDRRGTGGIVLKPVGIIRRPEVQERVHVDLVIVHTDSAAHDEVFPACRLISKAQAWSKIVFVGREDRADAIALNLDAAGGRNKYRQVLGGAVERTKVVPSQTPVEVESARDLPSILHKEIQSVDDDFPLGVTYGNRGGLNIACQEVCQGKNGWVRFAQGIRAAGSRWIRGAIPRPRPLRTVEHKFAKG